MPVYIGKAAKTVTADNVRTFWGDHPALASQRGCYIFAIRSGPGMTPIYVGCATKTFKQEVFAPHKLAKYQQALADYRKGTPVLLFLVAPQRRGAPNVGRIQALEEFLIQTAVARNPDLLNVRGTKRAGWAIHGVLRGPSGKPSNAARALKTMLDI